ncbi:sensor histidine kinase [Kiloniella litopenaei]|uniref:sensor histidine kinase n=1 Tax=Kiloniella litopenaei TaxID=1549748 RepID=UPI000698DE8A|nr:HAMP domain-containing sensor histidine kinase [Kiloniella litopenaei]
MKTKAPHLSLSLKFALSFGAIFIISTLVFEAVVSETSEYFMEKEIDSKLQTKISDMRGVYELGGIDLLTKLIEKRSAQSDAETRIYLLADADFQKLSGNINHWPAGVPRIAGWTELEDTDENPNEYRFLALNLDDKYYLLLGLDTIKEEELEDYVFLIFLGAVLFSITGGCAAGFFLHHNLKNRLDLISNTCTDIMQGHFSHRIPVSHTSDEIDVMAHTLNAMLDRIETLMDGIRHVTDNIAHDLRTPLTRVHGRLESLLVLTKGDKNRQLVESTIAEVDQLLMTFTALLSISRLETGELETNFKPIRLPHLVKDTIEIYEPLAEDKGQQIILNDALMSQHTDNSRSSGDKPLISGDCDLIAQCVSNLLDNAIKYGPENSVITIRIDNSDTHVTLSIHDQGNGIPEAEHKKVLERFYRVESSRNLPGNGLGLALVSAVIHLHNGNMKFRNEKGFQVEVSLPIATPLRTTKI